jgi:uncharacterized protein
VRIKPDLTGVPGGGNMVNHRLGGCQARRHASGYISTLMSALILIGIPVTGAPTPAAAQGRQPAAPPADPLVGIADRMNANTVALVSGALGGTYLNVAYDLATVLNNGDAFRVMPMVSNGTLQNFRDVRFLKGVDLGIGEANLLKHVVRSNELGPLDEKLRYIVKLFNEEVHIVVRANSGINSFADLNGKRVNVGDIGGGTQMDARDLFGRFGIKPLEVNMSQIDALEKMKTGELAATIYIAGKPAAAMARLQPADGYRLLPMPFTTSVQDEYLPATMSSQEYPGLIPQGGTIETLAVGTVLFAYNWPKNTDRYQRIEKFVNELFPRIAEFQRPPRHPKWKETNLSAQVAGWKRFPAADEWLARNSNTAADNSRAQFEKFLAARSTTTDAASPPDRERLFNEFLRWNATRSSSR